jgi:hypothetical protein
MFGGKLTLSNIWDQANIFGGGSGSNPIKLLPGK